MTARISTPPSYYSDRYQSAFARVLPYMEQQPLFNSINFDSSPSSAGALVANLTVMTTSLGMLLCPSDTLPPVRGYGRVNYRVNVGPTQYCAPDERVPTSWAGAFTVHRVYSAADFPDGLSNTVGVSERLQGDWTKGAFKSGADYIVTTISPMAASGPDQAVQISRELARLASARVERWRELVPVRAALHVLQPLLFSKFPRSRLLIRAGDRATP